MNLSSLGRVQKEKICFYRLFLKAYIFASQLHWKRLLDRIFHDTFSDDEEIVVLATDYIQKVSDIIKTTSKR